jgi:hypothetical protein
LGPKFHTEFGVPSKWIESLASNLSQLVTRCSLLPLEIERLNEKPIYPVMDYERGFLNSKDSIQLSPGTHLIIDETRLSSGQLNEIGKDYQAAAKQRFSMSHLLMKGSETFKALWN